MSDFPVDLSQLNLSSLLKLAGELRERIRHLEETLGRIQVDAVVAGGMVQVQANGKGEITALTLDPELLAMQDKVMLENLILAGVNQALNEARKRREEETQKLTGGLLLPGWFA